MPSDHDTPSAIEQAAIRGAWLGFLKGVTYANRHWEDEGSSPEPNMMYIHFCESDESENSDQAKIVEKVVAIVEHDVP